MLGLWAVAWVPVVGEKHPLSGAGDAKAVSRDYRLCLWWCQDAERNAEPDADGEDISGKDAIEPPSCYIPFWLIYHRRRLNFAMLATSSGRTKGNGWFCWSLSNWANPARKATGWVSDCWRSAASRLCGCDRTPHSAQENPAAWLCTNPFRIHPIWCGGRQWLKLWYRLERSSPAPGGEQIAQWHDIDIEWLNFYLSLNNR